MRPARKFAVAAAAAVVCAAAPVAALTCHTVFDRNDNVVYRDVSPPVDMSDRGAAQRTALRQRGEFLMTVEADQCPRVSAPGGPTGTSGATVDEIVAGLRPYNVLGAGIMSSAGTGASAPASRGTAAPARSSMPARSGY